MILCYNGIVLRGCSRKEKTLAASMRYNANKVKCMYLYVPVSVLQIRIYSYIVYTLCGGTFPYLDKHAWQGGPRDVRGKGGPTDQLQI